MSADFSRREWVRRRCEHAAATTRSFLEVPAEVEALAQLQALVQAPCDVLGLRLAGK